MNKIELNNNQDNIQNKMVEHRHNHENADIVCNDENKIAWNDATCAAWSINLVLQKRLPRRLLILWRKWNEVGYITKLKEIIYNTQTL